MDIQTLDQRIWHIGRGHHSWSLEHTYRLHCLLAICKHHGHCSQHFRHWLCINSLDGIPWSAGLWWSLSHIDCKKDLYENACTSIFLMPHHNNEYQPDRKGRSRCKAQDYLGAIIHQSQVIQMVLQLTSFRAYGTSLWQEFQLGTQEQWYSDLRRQVT